MFKVSFPTNISTRCTYPRVLVVLLALLCVYFVYNTPHERNLHTDSGDHTDHTDRTDGTNRPEQTDHQTQMIIKNIEVLPSSEVRRRLNESSGPFLGSGFFYQFFDKLTLREAQVLFHENIISLTHNCSKMKRFGHVGDGGYDVCMDEPFAPKKNNCLVYSFGINNEWSFDDAINDYFGCDVHSFDPSMNKKDHKHREPNMYFHNLGIWGSNFRNKKNWELKDLATIIKDLKHENRVIDYLKIDIEGAEWPVITHLITSGVHKQIKQMVLELHTPRLKEDGQSMTIADYGEIYHGLKRLGEFGFEKFIYHSNNGCCGGFAELTPASIARKKLCCYEAAYVNINYLK